VLGRPHLLFGAISELVHVRPNLRHLAVVHLLPLADKEEVIKHTKHVLRGLMNNRHDGLATIGETSQRLNDLSGLVTIKTTRRFVEHDDGR